MNKILNIVERIGNKLPHPFMLFCLLSIFIIILTSILSFFDISSTNPKTGEEIFINSLLSREGVQFIFTSVVKNYMDFPPVGLVLVTMFGVGLANRAGLLPMLIYSGVTKVPKKILTFVVFVAGITGSITSDANYIVFIPLVAMVYYSLGRHPIAGAAAAYAAAGAGYDVSLLVTSGDAIFAGLTTEAARIINPNFYVSPIDNYYFAVASVFVLALLGTFLIDKIIEPRLQQTLNIDKDIQKFDFHKPTPTEINALKHTFIVFVCFMAILFIILYPQNSPLRNDQGGLVPSPFLQSFVAILFLFFITMGITYGYSVGKIKELKNIPSLMAETIKDIAPTLTLFFVISQFIAYFRYSNLGEYIAINGSIFLENTQFTGYMLMIAFILMTAFLNVFMTSGTAQWSLMSPIFVPMFMLIDYHPAFTLAMYKIGDSTTNIISPMSPYFSVALVYMQQYKKDLGIGSLMSIMLPLSLGLLCIWTILLLLWVFFGLPFGPGIYPNL